MLITTRCMNDDGGIYYFTKKFKAAADARMKIKIFAQTRYILYINHKFIAEGPCRSAEHIRYFDEIRCKDVLQDGENIICVKVLHMRKKNEFTTVYKSETPLLYLESEIEKENSAERLCADSTWDCVFDRAHKLIYDDKYFKTTAPNEEILPGNGFEPIAVAGIDESPAKENLKWGIARPYEMLPRPIPMMYYGEKKRFAVIKKGKGFIELAAEEYVTAHVQFVFTGDIGEAVKIIYSECYQFGDKKYSRSDTNGQLSGKSDIVHLEGGEKEFSPFWFRAFRFIRIEFENNAELVSADYIETHYPLDITASFVCSNSVYNKMYRVSVRTMLCCMHEIFVDCPYREQQQYIMDSALEMVFSLCMSEDTRLIEKMICEFEASQSANGLLRANYPCDQIQYIPPFSFFWIMLLKDYLQFTGNQEFVRKRIGTVEKIINRFECATDQYGLVPISPYWDFVDWVPEWGGRGMPSDKAGDAITVHNLYYAYALRCAQNICRCLGLNGLAHEYDKRYGNIKKALNTYCYDADEGLYTDTRQNRKFSEHTIIWAVLAETMPRRQLRNMIEKIGRSSITRCTFSMKYYMFRAFEKIGKYTSLQEHLKDWETMLNRNCATWCENPDAPQSECHGWSSAPLYVFTANILGVKVNAVKKVIYIEPQCLDLTFAKGSVPTVFGIIYVSWEVRENTFTISIVKQSNIDVLVKMPDGEIQSFCEERKEFNCKIGKGSI